MLAASGLHPVCPGETRFEITSPLFEEVKIDVGRVGVEGPEVAATGRIFTIRAKNNSSENIYIQAATLNGTPYNRCWLDYKDISAGGVLELVMGPEPNRQWGLESGPGSLEK